MFDANSLLTLYRLSLDDRGRVLDLLDAIKDRIWLPFQVAFEFHKNRLDVVREQLDAYIDVTEKIGSLRNQIVDSAKSHPVLSQSSIRREIGDRLTSLEQYVAQQRDERHPEDIRDPYRADGVLDSLSELFAGRVGPRPAIDDDTLKVAAKRFDDKVPPGYEDHKKPVPDRYGDYFLWRETLEYWGTSGQNWADGLVLVTEETKPDWWLKSSKEQRIVQPRPELVREAAERGLTPFWMVSLRRFYSNAAAALGWQETELGEFAAVVSDDGTAAEEAQPEHATTAGSPPVVETN